MADIDTIQGGFEAVLDAISGVRAHSEWPNTVEIPAGGVLVWPYLVSAQYHETLGGDDTELEFDIYVIAAQGVGRARASQILNDYLSSTGTKSIAKTLRDDEDVNGTVSGILSIRLKNNGTIEIDDIQYIGAVIGVRVYAE